MPYLFIGSLIAGFILWYIYYSVECVINGGSIMRNTVWEMQWKCFLEELSWFLPGGNKRRIQFLKNIGCDEKDLDKLPGRFHFIFTHIFIPLFPTLILLLIIKK